MSICFGKLLKNTKHAVAAAWTYKLLISSLRQNELLVDFELDGSRKTLNLSNVVNNFLPSNSGMIFQIRVFKIRF